jgi:hypothetical protein
MALPAPLAFGVISWALVHSSLSPVLMTVEQPENPDVLGLVWPASVVVSVAVIESPADGSALATLNVAVPPLPIVTSWVPR